MRRRLSDHSGGARRRNHLTGLILATRLNLDRNVRKPNQRAR
jgi:hypothetical protein